MPQEVTSRDVEGGDIQMGQELLNVPMGTLLRGLALGIAKAQFELDKSSLVVAEHMSGHRMLRDTQGRLLNDKGEPSNDAAEVPVIYDTRVYFGYDEIGGRKIPTKVSMMELGFTPNFYQFVDTIIEIKISIRIKREALSEEKKSGVETEYGPGSESLASSSSSSSSDWWGWGQTTSATTTVKRTRMVTTTTPVNSRFTSKFNYSAEGSSLIRTKLVPLPPPAILEERVRKMMDQRRAEFERNNALPKYDTDENGIRVTYQGEETDEPKVKISKVGKTVDFAVSNNTIDIKVTTDGATVDGVLAAWAQWTEDNETQGFNILENGDGDAMVEALAATSLTR